jgi:hypothetical protein
VRLQGTVLTWGGGGGYTQVRERESWGERGGGEAEGEAGRRATIPTNQIMQVQVPEGVPLHQVSCTGMLE